MLRRIDIVIILFFLLILSGCAGNPYAKFYHDNMNGADLTKIESLSLGNGDPEIIRGNNPDIDHIRMTELGYFLIGTSLFNSGERNDAELFSFAKSIKAEKVIIYTKYSHTNSGMMPLTLPETKTYNTNFSGNIYNVNSGNTSYYGNATTTSFGTRTTYIPYNVARYDYFVTYWVKLNLSKIDFGADVVPLPPEVKSEIGSNKGVLVIGVVEKTPAYDSDIVRGDIITAIAGYPINNMDDYFNVKKKVAGQSVNVRILRKGTTLNKKVQFRQVVFNNKEANRAEVNKVRGK